MGRTIYTPPFLEPGDYVNIQTLPAADDIVMFRDHIAQNNMAKLRSLKRDPVLQYRAMPADGVVAKRTERGTFFVVLFETFEAWECSPSILARTDQSVDVVAVHRLRTEEHRELFFRVVALHPEVDANALARVVCEGHEAGLVAVKEFCLQCNALQGMRELFALRGVLQSGSLDAGLLEVLVGKVCEARRALEACLRGLR